MAGSRESTGSLNTARNSAHESNFGLQQAQPSVPIPEFSPRLQKTLKVQPQSGADAQPERTFKGTLPPDWARSQQDSLLLAVVDVSNRMKIRPPGPRAMQAVMAARSGEQAEAAIPYDQE